MLQQQPGESPAAACRRNHWHVGTHLAGDEGYGETVIRITAIGEDQILARAVARKGKPVQGDQEGSWTLYCREWRRVRKP